MSLKPVDAATVKSWLDAGDAVLVDIRERNEHAAEHIAGAHLVPLSELGEHDLKSLGKQQVVFHCKGGMRTTTNAGKLAAACEGELFELTGGIEGWKRAGLPVKQG
ncbi:hypothetical protein F2P47_04565 [Parvibaculum sedimenti]|uniref:Rhodanese domain-containing protein n=1 Tax=Parvibaculum sedimenti TaxID=2608632 RepID=A0A6N6VLN6_9HYPH|nr:rhodanese-like domain-containing protein [Parvibaculum sedimenti]KAB7741682.1 hypothetical protein F2P47_04565 [Parvibaculum sedimenti]